MCGENLIVTAAVAASSGSPPRVRGKLVKIDNAALVKRITPACAGKTFIVNLARKDCEDHPRVCGENYKILYTVYHIIGSPPRVRGKRG